MRVLAQNFLPSHGSAASPRDGKKFLARTLIIHVCESKMWARIIYQLKKWLNLIKWDADEEEY